MIYIYGSEQCALRSQAMQCHKTPTEPPAHALIAVGVEAESPGVASGTEPLRKKVKSTKDCLHSPCGHVERCTRVKNEASMTRDEW